MERGKSGYLQYDHEYFLRKADKANSLVAMKTKERNTTVLSSAAVTLEDKDKKARL